VVPRGIRRHLLMPYHCIPAPITAWEPTQHVLLSSPRSPNAVPPFETLGRGNRSLLLPPALIMHPTPCSGNATTASVSNLALGGQTRCTASSSGARSGSGTKSLKPPRGLHDLVGPSAPFGAVHKGAKQSAQGPLRFVSTSAFGQHPVKRDAGYVYADAVANNPRLLGICDGVSGVQALGLQPDELPRQLLEQCSKVMDVCIAAEEIPCGGDGHWLMSLLQDAYDQTIAWGATTVLLAAMEDNRCLVVANVGDCGLLVFRPDSSQPSRFSKEFRTDALRYEANKPVQVMRLANSVAAQTHLVIQGARVNTVRLCPGDLVVLGSDGIFDNLSDEDISLILEGHCAAATHAPADDNRFAAGAACPDSSPVPSGVVPEQQPQLPPPRPTVVQLKRAAAALVDSAIASVRVDAVTEATEEQPWEASRRQNVGGNADDTTVIVALVVEASELQEAEQEDAAQNHVPCFRVVSRRSPATRMTATNGDSILGLGLVPHCCNTSADRGDELKVGGMVPLRQECLCRRDGKMPQSSEVVEDSEVADDAPGDQCSIS